MLTTFGTELRSVSQLNGSASQSQQLGQSEFFALMIAQLRNQDPTSPQDGAEFLGQLAQFGTVNGISEMQSSLERLALSLQSGQALQAASMIDREVLIPSNQAWLEEDGSLRGRVELPAPTSQLTVRITNEAGVAVRTISLGAQNGGPVDFSWDGNDASGEPAAPGIYRVEVEGLYGGELASLVPLVAARVEGVSFGGPGGGTQLTLAGLGQVSLYDVREIG